MELEHQLRVLHPDLQTGEREEGRKDRDREKREAERLALMWAFDFKAYSQ